MNVRLRMYQVLLFKFRRHLCKGSIGTCLTLPNLEFLWALFKYPKIYPKMGSVIFSYVLFRIDPERTRPKRIGYDSGRTETDFQ